MATFKFGRYIDIHWNGYDIQGPADTVFSIPDQLYEEFDADIAPVEPTLVWLDTNEFLTLQNNVSVSTLSATFPIALATSTSGKTISLSSSTNPNGYLLAADGSGGIIFTPASTSGLTSVVGASPISSTIAGGTATVSIDQAAITGATAATNAQVVRFYVKNTTGTTIPKGSSVYVSGATGDNALISLASATSEPSSSKTLGITAEAIDNDAFGYVIEAGYLTDIDTSATTAGAAVWLGNTPGSLVFVSPPAEPSHAVYLGVVVRVQSNNGSILVKVQNGYELDELHDVFVGGVSTALPLVYSSTSSGWIAQALSSVGISDNAIVTSKIIDSGVTSAKVADDAIITSKILDAAVTSAKIAAAAINSTHIGANAVVAGDIAANAITSGNIAAGAVGSSQLADNAVVAAKIAANAVGVVAINSGSATNSTVLTADGSGGASFLPVSGTQFLIGQNTYSGILISSKSSSVQIGVSTSTVISGVNGIFCFDETSGTAFQVVGRNCIVKSTITSGAVVSQTYYTALTANEEFTGIAVNTGSTRNVCAISSSIDSTTTQVAKYYVIDPAAMTVKNSGNLAGATGNVHYRSKPKVWWDPALSEFTIRLSVFTSTQATGFYRGVLRTLHPTTYATRVHTFATGLNVPNEDGLPSTANNGDTSTNIIYVAQHTSWITARSGSGNISTIQFYADSGASSQFLTLTSSRSVTFAADGMTGFTAFAPLQSNTAATIYWQGRTTSSNSDKESTHMFKIALSNISAGFTTTGITNLSALTSFGGGLTAWNSALSSFNTWTIGGNTYVGNPYAYIILDSSFAFTNPYSEVYHTGPGGPANVPYGTVYSDSGTARLAINAAANTTASSFGGIRTYNLSPGLNIDFVSQSSTAKMMIGIAPLSYSPSSINPSYYGAAINGSFATAAGIAASVVTSPSEVYLLNAGYTYRYKWMPLVSQSDTTVTLPNHWTLKQ